MIEALAYAKVNLYLAVLAQRPDGYHDIETVFHSVDLADRIAIRSSDELKVECSVPELGGSSNLAFVAAERLRSDAGISAGALIQIDKHIPVAAGLAGGSADAAAVLVALNRMWKLDLSLKQLADVGARIGSDVPFCLLGGAALGTGTGTDLEDAPTLPPCRIVLAKPRGELSAAHVYATYDDAPVSPLRPPAQLLAALSGGDLAAVCSLVENVLEGPVEALLPDVGPARLTALEAGAQCATVSGSGPTVFAIAEKAELAERVAAALEPICEYVHICRPVGRGVELARAP